MTRPTNARRRAIAGVAAAALAASGAALLAPGTSSASSHREAPLTSANPLADNTDVYAFVSPDNPKMTTLIANWIPFEDPAGGPNFYPFGADGYRYNIKVDNNGDGISDVTYQWTFHNVDKRGTNTFLYANGAVNSFNDPNLLFKQTYTLAAFTGKEGKRTVLVNNGEVAPSDVGKATFPNYAALRNEAITPVPGGGKSFAGQADDPFFLDLRIFDLLYGANLKEVGSDTLNGYNVNSIALQVPTAELTKGGDESGIVGVWSTTDQQTMQLTKGASTPTGPYVQVSRLSAPLVNEVIIPAGLKDAFNSLNPVEDKTVPAAVNAVLNPEVPRLIEAIYGIKAPATPRDDLFAAFLTGISGLNQPPAAAKNPAEMMRLNTGIAPAAKPNRLGVLAGDNAGFPNGRRLADDVVDIELQALEGAIRTGKLNPALTDKVDQNDKAFGKAFPYLALPTSGSSTQARGTSKAGGGHEDASNTAAAAPSGAVAAGTGGSGSSLPVVPAGLGLLGLAVVGAGTLLVRRRSAAGQL